jgi:hypothetical protein
MAQRHTPQQQFHQACQIARDNGMFVVDKGGRFLVYRKAAPRNVCLGECASAATLYRKVSRCADIGVPKC